ncbi:AT-RICH INTERACTIVE DOMAIN-CONTAINING PROTEIN 6-LIKE [Salix purpurea]|uniref:AT-RICH INTERACTIVE DOMAIN-CONTAINING PROTEIN 6-LIKE n=1 Tax=Salix purpurea TaxID=77065 RepID=A0A9Q0WEN2_SALPP|nr:AT-RICH INTERACTIVE DOMAIN-CONTAINING PROTEIN 6-LIKE [Salix purpurea]
MYGLRGEDRGGGFIFTIQISSNNNKWQVIVIIKLKKKCWIPKKKKKKKKKQPKIRSPLPTISNRKVKRKRSRKGEPNPKPEPSSEDPKALEEKGDTQSSVDLTDTNPATPHPHDHDTSNAAAADSIKSEGKGDETVDSNNDPHDEPNTDGATTATNVAGADQLSSPPTKNDDEGTHSPPPPSSHSGPKAEDEEDDDEKSDVVPTEINKKEAPKPPKLDVSALHTPPPLTKSFLLDSSADGYETTWNFKPPKFYKEELNLLKLWRLVIKLGGYEQVTSCKLWRQVGESFKPPKTCTTVSWTFRIFYEKALLEYEKNKLKNGELPFSDGPLTESMRTENQAGGSQALASGRARRDAAARAMQGWHSQRLLGNGEVCHPIIKDKNLSSTPKGDKQLKTNGLLKRKRLSPVEGAVHFGHKKTIKPQGDAMVIDVGPPADWVKINVQKTNDCFEIYALVPGLLREEVHVQSDPAGRLIISGQPEHLDNPWGVTPFKKVVSLPTRIDPHQTSAVVTLHGQLFVRVPFEMSDL